MRHVKISACVTNCLSQLRYQAVDINVEGVFKGVSDRFNGVTIDSTTESCEAAQFDGILSSKYNLTMMHVTSL